MNSREAVPNYGLPSRSILPLIWALVLIQVAVNAGSVIPPMEIASRGTSDFSIFYTGARILHFGWRHELYDLNVQARFHTIYYRDHPLPFNHPAYELLLFLPLAGWKFSAQYYSWLSINLIIVASIAMTLSKACDHPLLTRWVFLLSAALAFPPIAICLLQGQDTLLLTLIYSLTYWAMKQRRDFLAGLLLSLGLFKFHLVLPFLIPMLIRRYWKFLRGFLSGAAVLIAISITITGFNGFLQYIALLRLMTRRPDIAYTIPSLMANLRGLLAILVPAKPAADLAIVVLSAIAIALAARMMVPPSVRDRHFDASFALNLASVTLVSYNFYLHDLALAFIPIILAANVLNQTKAKIWFWCATALLFCMPIYALALNHMLVGLIALCMVLLAAALMMTFLKGIHPAPLEHA